MFEQKDEEVEFRWRLISTGLLLLVIGGVGVIEYFRGTW